PVLRLREAENGTPVVQLPLQRDRMASEFLRLKVVVRRPGSRPLRCQVEVHRRLQVLARRYPDERSASGYRPGWNSAVHAGRLILNALGIDDWIAQSRGAEYGRIELHDESIACRRPLATLAVLQVEGPALSRWYRVLAVPHRDAGDGRGSNGVCQRVIRTPFHPLDLRILRRHCAAEHSGDRAKDPRLRVEGDGGVDSLTKR